MDLKDIDQMLDQLEALRTVLRERAKAAAIACIDADEHKRIVDDQLRHADCSIQFLTNLRNTLPGEGGAS